MDLRALPGGPLILCEQIFWDVERFGVKVKSWAWNREKGIFEAVLFPEKPHSSVAVLETQQVVADLSEGKMAALFAYRWSKQQKKMVPVFWSSYWDRKEKKCKLTINQPWAPRKDDYKLDGDEVQLDETEDDDNDDETYVFVHDRLQHDNTFDEYNSGMDNDDDEESYVFVYAEPGDNSSSDIRIFHI